MHLSKEDLQSESRIRRLNIVNSITGVKPANLIGTISPDKVLNLAIFSSVVHLGSNPGLIGFVLRPGGEVRRHTYENIRASGEYTINSLGIEHAERGHYTSAKYSAEVSEFEELGFDPEFLGETKAPFVKQSRLKFALRLVEEIPISLNGTTLVVGEVQDVFVEDDAVSEDGYIDLDSLGSAGISGLNSYYKLQKFAEYPYARPGGYGGA